MRSDDTVFEQLKTSADPAILVVTTSADDTFAGCLVGFHSQSSMDPLQYAFWLSKANHTYLVGLRATHFVAHFLTENDRDVAEHFGGTSGHDTDKFAAVDIDRDAHGTPVLRQCRDRLYLEKISLLDTGGDHVCVIASVQRVDSAGPFEPLRLRDIDHIAPGRDEAQRAIRP